MGQLFGSVTSRDISEAIIQAGYEVEKRQVVMDSAIKTLGLFNIKLALHPEVTKKIVVNVARSLEEAKTQLESGKAVITDPDHKNKVEDIQISKNEKIEKYDDKDEKAIDLDTNKEKIEERQKEG